MSIHACQRNAVAVSVLLTLVFVGSCSGSSTTPTPSPSLSPTPSASPAPTEVVRTGSAITAADAEVSLSYLADDGHYWLPMAGSGDRIVIARIPMKGPDAATEPWSYYVWDLVSGTMEEGWTDPSGTQETSADMLGDWYVAVQRGFGGTAAYDEWSIYLRNLGTGEVRMLGENMAGDTSDLPMVHGYDPAPSIANDFVVWSQQSGTSSIVYLYHLSLGTIEGLASAEEPEVLWSASVGNRSAVWLRGDEDGTEIVYRRLDTHYEEAYAVNARAIAAQVTEEGGFVAWDEGTGSYDKHIFDTVGEFDRLIAEGQGFGVYVSGRYTSWDTATGQASAVHPSGLYDFRTNELRTLDTDDSLTNVGHVMGDWFVWQDIPKIGGDYDYEQGRWYAMRLDPGPSPLAP